MSTMRTPQPAADDDLELLLPFYAIGKAAPDDAEAIEARLAFDPEFRRRMELIAEERLEAQALNASIAPRSDVALRRLFTLIDADATPVVAQVAAYGAAPVAAVRAPSRPAAAPGSWLARLQDALTPKMAGFAIAGLAAIAIVQAGFLTHLANRDAPVPQGYVTASAPPGLEAPQLLVRFAPGATMADAAAWLAANHTTIVDGPKPGGLWRVQITGDANTRDAARAKLRANTSLFDLVIAE